MLLAPSTAYNSPFNAAEAARADVESKERRLAVLDEADDAGKLFVFIVRCLLNSNDLIKISLENTKPADLQQQSFVQRTVTTVVSNLQVSL